MQERINYKNFNFEVARDYLGGKNIVFTGRGFLVRGELMRLARQAGAMVDTVVTKKCDILIVGEKPGSKLRKAKVLGCQIISDEEFKEILEGKILKDEDVKIEINHNILNINLNNDDSEKIDIENKNIVVLVNNEVLREKVIRNIQKNHGKILGSIEEENVDILVYQPNIEFSTIVKKAEHLKIQVLTIGKFNKMIL